MKWPSIKVVLVVLVASIFLMSVALIYFGVRDLAESKIKVSVWENENWSARTQVKTLRWSGQLSKGDSLVVRAPKLFKSNVCFDYGDFAGGNEIEPGWIAGHIIREHPKGDAYWINISVLPFWESCPEYRLPNQSST